MDELVRWLGAQLDEDEYLAKDAIDLPGGDGRWQYVETRGGDHKVIDSLGYTVTGHYDDDAHPWACEPHIARHDPARVLRETDAKRRTLLRCGEEMFSGIPRLVHFAKQTVREMAAVYEDRPGYEAALAAFE